MWIIRCAQACRGILATHPITAGVPAAIVTVGAGAALTMLAATKPVAPQLPCGCHQVWVAPVVPMTPATYGKVVNSLADSALAGVPLADAPGNLITGEGPFAPLPFPPLSPVSKVVLLRTLPPTSPHDQPHPVPVPEPSSFAVALGGLLALAGLYRRRRSPR